MNINQSVVIKGLSDHPWSPLGPYGPDGGILKPSVYAFFRDFSNFSIVGTRDLIGGIYRKETGGLWIKVLTGDAYLFSSDPQNEANLYAAVQIPNFNRVLYRSSDGGLSWSPVFTTTSIIGKIVIANNNSIFISIINPIDFVTALGLYRSTDLGANWVQVLSTSIKDFAIKSDNPQHIYLFADDDANELFLFMISENGGNTWFSPPPPTGSNSFPTYLEEVSGRMATYENSIFYLVQNPNRHFFGSYRSDDNGLTWIKYPPLVDIFDGTLLNISLNFWSDPSDPSHLMFGFINYWNSYDGGVSWTAVSPFYFGPCNELYLTPTRLTLCADKIYQSIDRGVVWDTIPNFDEIHQATQIYLGNGRLDFVVYMNGNIYTGNAGGFWISSDNGVSWRSLNDNLPTAACSSAVINNDGTIYLATGVAAWTQIVTQDMYQEPSSAYSYGVYKTSDNGQTWSLTGLSFNPSQLVQINKIVMSPNNNLVLICATTQGLYRSDDGGDSWSRVSPMVATDLQFKPGNDKIVYAASTVLERSLDNGLTWTFNKGVNLKILCGENRGNYSVGMQTPDWLVQTILDKTIDKEKKKKGEEIEKSKDRCCTKRIKLIAADPLTASTFLNNSKKMAFNIALIQKDKSVSYADQIWYAQQAGAVGAIIFSDILGDNTLVNMQQDLMVGTVSFKIDSPDSIDGRYPFGLQVGATPSWSAHVGTFTGKVIIADPILANTQLNNAAEINGNIALVRKGDVTFSEKILNCQNAGAIAVIIQNVDETFSDLFETPPILTIIPAIIVQKSTGDSIIATITAGREVISTLVYPIVREAVVSIPGFYIGNTLGISLLKEIQDGKSVKLEIKTNMGVDVPYTPVGMMKIGVSGSTVYTIASGVLGGLLGILRSDNSGCSFNRVLNGVGNNLLGLASGSDGLLSIAGEGITNLAIFTSPIDPNSVTVGSSRIYTTSDGFCHFAEFNTPNMASPDVTDFAIDSSTGALYMSSNTGVYRIDNDSRFVNINNGALSTISIYRFNSSRQNKSRILMGTQYLGAIVRSDDLSWSQLDSTRPGTCFFDWDTDDRKFLADLVGRLVVIFNGTPQSITPRLNPSSTNPPIEAVPPTPWLQRSDDPNIIVAAYNVVFAAFSFFAISFNKGNSWFFAHISNSSIHQLAHSPLNPDIYYATTSTNLYISINGGRNWNLYLTNIDRLSSLQVSPSNPFEIIFCFANYDPGAKVYTIKNNSLINLSQGLPNVAFYSVIYDPTSSVGGIYLGGEGGVWYRDNTMSSWQKFSHNLPGVIVTDMNIYANERLLRCATVGRGAWETTLV